MWTSQGLLILVLKLLIVNFVNLGKQTNTLSLFLSVYQGFEKPFQICYYYLIQICASLELKGFCKLVSVSGRASEAVMGRMELDLSLKEIIYWSLTRLYIFYHLYDINFNRVTVFSVLVTALNIWIRALIRSGRKIFHYWWTLWSYFKPV